VKASGERHDLIGEDSFRRRQQGRFRRRFRLVLFEGEARGRQRKDL
jgi:hypothetical protein